MTSNIKIPTLLVSAGTPGHLSVEVEGLEHPVLLARYANRLKQAGLHKSAATVRLALSLADRCELCGRRMPSERMRHATRGRECAHPRPHRIR